MFYQPSKHNFKLAYDKRLRIVFLISIQNIQASYRVIVKRRYQLIKKFESIIHNLQNIKKF